MPNISLVLADLQTQRKRVQSELHHLDDAIGALKGLVAGNHTGRNRVGTRRRRRKLSVAARNRIAAAQRARWAKFKQQQKKAA
jgi:hypothetical protein